jgi:hypothetical protein
LFCYGRCIFFGKTGLAHDQLLKMTREAPIKNGILFMGDILNETKVMPFAA